ncbi:hypothetical protein [Cellulomonas soli]
MPASASTTPGAAGPTDGGLLTLGLGDVPDEQRRRHVTWDGTHGHLLVLGGPRSGRTTTLLSLGLQAASRGWTVHAVGLPAHAVATLATTGRLGTDVGPDDPRRLARLLELLPAARVTGHGTCCWSTASTACCPGWRRWRAARPWNDSPGCGTTARAP